VVHFKIDGQGVETLDAVRYRAVLDFIDSLGPQVGEWPQTRALGDGGEIDGPALIAELDQLGRYGVPDDVAQMLGNIWNDVLRTLRRQGKLGPEE
jgi:hypothetical protein